MRIFDDDDGELPRGTDGEIVLRPKRPHTMFEGYWGRPDATVATSRNWWYHTGDIGRIDEDGYLYFVDRKADYLRRRGENISSFEVERIVVQHPALADVAVHAVPSQLTEDDLKITATRARRARRSPRRRCSAGASTSCPYFALPRYIELRAELPRSPVGRVLKRELRDEAPHRRVVGRRGVRHHLREALRASAADGSLELGLGHLGTALDALLLGLVVELRLRPAAWPLVGAQAAAPT